MCEKSDFIHWKVYTDMLWYLYLELLVYFFFQKNTSEMPKKMHFKGAFLGAFLGGSFRSHKPPPSQKNRPLKMLTYKV